MRRGYLLLLTALLSFGGMGLANCVSAPVEVEASKPVEHREIVIPRTPTPVPERPNFDLSGLKICQKTSTPIPTATPEPTPEPIEEECAPLSLGVWTVTAYCNCEICCGEYAAGYTASGTLATEGRTVACNSLPMGTEIIIDGHEYIVEDTGWTPYGEAWIDLYFDSHDAAIAFGVQEKEVYLLAG